MKKDPSLPIEPVYLSDSLADHPAVRWMSDNGRAILLFIFASTLLALFYQRFSGGETAGAGDYLQAEKAYVDFTSESASDKQQEAYKRLTNLLKKYPDLQSKYDGAIAQTLLNRDDAAQAKEFADRTLTRTRSDHLELHADYSNTTLLMAGGNYADALKEAQALQVKLQAPSKEEIGALYLFNTLRIALLNQELGHAPEELKAWQTFKSAAVQKGSASAAAPLHLFENLVARLEDGNVSILNYIDAREKALKK